MEIGFLQEVKAIIKSLVLSSTSLVSIDRLMKDYKEMEGHYIPYKSLGFRNVESFLRSMPDTVRVDGTGDRATVRFVSNQKSDHIHQMICKQKKPKRSSGQRNYQQINQPAFGSTFPSKGQHRSTNLSYNITSTSSNTRYSGFSKSMERGQDTLQTQAQPTRCSIENQISGTGYNNPGQFATAAQMRHGKTDERHLYKQSRTISESTESYRVPLTKRSEPRTKASPTKADFSEKYLGDTFPSSQQSEPTTSVLPNTLGGIEKQSKNEWLFSIAPKPEKVYADKIKMLNNNFNKSLNIIEPNEPRPTCAESFQQNAIDKSYATKRGSSYDRLKDLDKAVPEFALNSLVFRMDFPENAVPFGQKIVPYSMPADIKQGSIIGIFISEVHNPFKFWFQICKENHELDSLMDQIERFYKPLDAEDLRIPRICITPGQICAALYHDMWHRAEIVSPVISNKAKVLFVDYGTVTDINVNDIKYLPTMFANVPTQAIRGCLSHIEPAGLHWSLEATNHFLSMVSDLMLYAQVSEMDEPNRTFYMVICDTNGNEVIQINKALVDNGFAVYIASWHEPEMQKMGQRCRHPRENFPTFTMIERGEYPSFAELVNLHVGGMDYEAITDRILIN